MPQPKLYPHEIILKRLAEKHGVMQSDIDDEDISESLAEFEVKRKQFPYNERMHNLSMEIAESIQHWLEGEESLEAAAKDVDQLTDKIEAAHKVAMQADEATLASTPTSAGLSGAAKPTPAPAALPTVASTTDKAVKLSERETVLERLYNEGKRTGWTKETLAAAGFKSNLMTFSSTGWKDGKFYQLHKKMHEKTYTIVKVK